MAKALLAALLCLLSLSAHAESTQTWFGVSLGGAELIHDDDYVESVLNTEKSPVVGVFGMGLHKSGFGMELAFMQFTEFKADNDLNSNTEEFSISTSELSALYQYWPTKSFGLGAKLGAAYWRFRGKLYINSVRYKTRKSDTSATGGVSLLFKLGEQDLLQLGVQHYGEMPDNGDANLIRLDYARRF